MADEYRKERIERLLSELKYEITRGMMEGDIEETLSFIFYVPVSKMLPQEGVVHCELRTRPLPRYCMHPDYLSDGAKLRVVK